VARLASPRERAVVVLMTASVTPKTDLPERTSIDQARRRRQYLSNLRFWASQDWSAGVVFAENTLAGLVDFEREAALPGGKPVEFLSVQGNDFPGRFGKGYGEAALLDRAFAESTLLREDVLVVKVTGLQYVTNVPRLLRRLPPEVELAVDIREHDVLERLGIGPAVRRCDTRCFLTTPERYRRHLASPHAHHTGEQFYLEAAYYERTRELRESQIRLRFPIELAFRGPAGHWDKDYGSRRERVKRAARGTIRALLPGLWI
jgi:hypothetical protein